MKKSLNLLLFCFLLPLSLFSQKIQIKGSVIDSLTHEPLTFATVKIVDGNNKLVFAGITRDSLANFNLINVPVKIGYTAIISYVGYKNKEIPIIINPDQKILDFGAVAIIQDINKIGEVQVTGYKKIQDLLDKAVYAVDSAMLAKSISTPDILKKIPEIMVNPLTLETKIKGKDNSLILVNGINTGHSINIRSINPKDIKKIEVITSPQSSIDVNYDGVINIILKQKPRKGFSGDFDATFMPNRRYADAYSGFVFGSNKIRLDAEYSNYLRNNSWDASEIRKGKDNNLYETTSYCKRPFEITHDIKLNFDYYLSPKDFINISTKNSFARVNKSVEFEPLFVGSNGIEKKLTPFSIKNSSDYFIGNYTVFYKRKMAKEGNSITANINMHYMNGDEYSDYSHQETPQHINSEKGKKQSVNMKVEHINQLGKTMELTVGTQAYYQKFNGSLSGATFDNDFTNTRYNAYADLYFKIKNVDVNLGLKAEQNKVTFKKHAFHSTSQKALFPTIVVSKQLNKASRLTAEYRRSTFYPSAWILAPYRIEIDSMTAVTGNPKIRPYVRDAFTLSHSLRKSGFSINTALYFRSINKLLTNDKSYDSNNFCTITYHDKADMVREGIKFSGSVSLFDFIEIEPNINFFHEEYHNKGITRHNTSFSSELMVSIGLPGGFGIGGFGSYNGKMLNPQGHTNSTYSLDAIFLMKYFHKQNLGLYVGLRGLAKSKEKTFVYDGDTESINTFKHDTYGLVFRITYSFNVGKKYRMERVDTFYESDKK